MMGSKISKAEKHLYQESKRGIDSMDLLLLFLNNAGLKLYRLLHVNGANFCR